MTRPETETTSCTQELTKLMTRGRMLRAVALGFGASILAACGDKNVPIATPVLLRPQPSINPTAEPTDAPTVTPKPNPTDAPTVEPTVVQLATPTPPATLTPTESVPLDGRAVFSINPQDVKNVVNPFIQGSGLPNNIRWPDDPQTVPLLRQGGIRFVRTAVVHNPYGLDGISGIVENAVRQGTMIRDADATPLGLIVGFPRELPRPKEFSREYWKSYAEQFITGLVTRNRGIIDHWELWNERDNEQKGKLTWLEYLDFANAAVLVIRAANPNAVIYGPAAPHDTHPDIGDAYRTGLFDVITYHNYPGQVEKAEETLEQTDERYRVSLGNLVDLYGKVGITEYNAMAAWGDREAFGKIGDPRVEQVIGVQNFVAKLNAWEVGAHCMNLHIIDEQGAALYGLVHDGVPRRRFDSWKVLAANLGSNFIQIDRSGADTVTKNRVRALATRSKNGQDAYVVLANMDPSNGYDISITGGISSSTVGISEFAADKSSEQRELSVSGDSIPHTLRPLGMVAFQIAL